MFLQVLGRPATPQSTFSPPLVDGLPERTHQQQINDQLLKFDSFSIYEIHWNVPKLPLIDHLGSSWFSLDSGNVPPLLLRGRWQNIYWSHNRKHLKKYDLTYFLSIIRDTYFTAISLELSPEQGMTSVSVYLRDRGQEIEQHRAKTFKTPSEVSHLYFKNKLCFIHRLNTQ